MEVDRNPRALKRPGAEGVILFKPHYRERVRVTGHFKEHEMPSWALEEQESFAEDLIWLRKVDETEWSPLDSDSITRDNNKECAFHHRWFTKSGEWDEETN